MGGSLGRASSNHTGIAMPFIRMNGGMNGGGEGVVLSAACHGDARMDVLMQSDA